MRNRLLALLTVVLVVSTGCLTLKRTSTVVAPEPVTIPLPAPSPPIASRVLPQSDLHMRVQVQDEGQAPYEVAEEWIREGSALVATYNGKPYVRWEINSDGLWRLDPKGGGALLRYLPPVLVDGTVWRQKSSDATVWFSLTRLELACDNGAGQKAECWELIMLNREESLTYWFAEAVGPVSARSRNVARQADSFVKRLISTEPGKASAEERTQLLKELVVTAVATPVETATNQEFQQAVADLVK